MRLVAWRAPDFALFPRMARAAFIDPVFDGRLDDRDHVIEVFERHIAEVKAAIPAERLLVFEAGTGGSHRARSSGYRCRLQPYPRVNERAAFRRKRPRRLARLILRGR